MLVNTMVMLVSTEEMLDCMKDLLENKSVHWQDCILD